MQRIIGTEVEYGISSPSDPTANPILTSTQAVLAYAAAAGIQRGKRTRWDYEVESPLRDARGFDLSRASGPAPIVDADEDYYLRIGTAALATLPVSRERPDAARRRWRRRQRKGKALTALRLAKATTTFAGGIDYLAWKINRHAGTKIEVTPWQRRHPILAGIILLPRLLRGGAVR